MKIQRWHSAILLLLLLLFLFSSELSAVSVRIKDISQVAGVRDNQLVGYGLVVGLAGKGDNGKSKLARETMARLLEKFDLYISPDDFESRNIATVVVTATLPPFARNGEKIDITVSSIGDARSLSGGVLLQTPLYAADGNIYAVGQGVIYVAGTKKGERESANKTVGYIAAGALIERAVTSDFVINEKIQLIFSDQDFATVSAAAKAINAAYADANAIAEDSGLLSMTVPAEYADNPVAFLGIIGSVEIEPETIARVVVDNKTGTIIMGGSVRISAVAIANRNLSIKIEDNGNTARRNKSQGVTGHMIALDEVTDVNAVVTALNAVGASTDDIIAILQALKAAGALHAHLQVL